MKFVWFLSQGTNGPRPTYAGANNGNAGSGGAGGGGGGVGVGVGPSAGGHGLKGGAGGGPRGGNPVQYRASGAGGTAWGAAPSHAAAAAAAAGYPPYTRYPSAAAAAAAAAAQMPVGAQQLPPTTNPYAATAYAQHASVTQNLYILNLKVTSHLDLSFRISNQNRSIRFDFSFRPAFFIYSFVFYPFSHFFWRFHHFEKKLPKVPFAFFSVDTKVNRKWRFFFFFKILPNFQRKAE